MPPGFFVRKKIRRLKGTVVLGLLFIALMLSNQVAEAATATATGTTFTEYLRSFSSSRFYASGPWSNGAPFLNGWLSDHVSFVNGALKLTFDNKASSGMPYSSGEYRTLAYYGYGCYESRFKPASVSGMVSSFFTYAGTYDKAPNATGQHNEIDVEFLGKNTRQVQFNFYTRDNASGVKHGYVYNMAFDASEAFHNYAFKWTAQGIIWYIDGIEVYRVNNNTTDPTPSAAEATQRIMMNLWAVDGTDGSYDWAGVFKYPGKPVSTTYNWVKYTASDSCKPTKSANP